MSPKHVADLRLAVPRIHLQTVRFYVELRQAFATFRIFVRETPPAVRRMHLLVRYRIQCVELWRVRVILLKHVSAVLPVVQQMHSLVSLRLRCVEMCLGHVMWQMCVLVTLLAAPQILFSLRELFAQLQTIVRAQRYVYAPELTRYAPPLFLHLLQLRVGLL